MYALKNGLFQASASLTGWVNSVPESEKATFRRAAHVTSVNHWKICVEGKTAGRIPPGRGISDLTKVSELVEKAEAGSVTPKSL